MNRAVERPTSLGRWALLGNPERRMEKPRGAAPGGELHCPVGHLLRHAGEDPAKMRGKSDVDSRQVSLLGKHFGINFNDIRRLMGLSQIESNEARAERAVVIYESLGIVVEPPPSEEGEDGGRDR